MLVDLPARIRALLPGCSQRSLRCLLASLRTWDTADSGKASLADALHVLRLGRLRLHPDDKAAGSGPPAGSAWGERDEADWEQLKKQVHWRKHVTRLWDMLYLWSCTLW